MSRCCCVTERFSYGVALLRMCRFPFAPQSFRFFVHAADIRIHRVTMTQVVADGEIDVIQRERRVHLDDVLRRFAAMVSMDDQINPAAPAD